MSSAKKPSLSPFGDMDDLKDMILDMKTPDESRSMLPNQGGASPRNVEEAFVQGEARHTIEATPWGRNAWSSQSRLLIKGGKVVNADMMMDADVFIEDGIIK
ncbi:hypothetical protein GQR58_005447 [Nymphon striatum]|nr:hypothetical protein GQR58_005447 [Nymphon striatum]